MPRRYSERKPGLFWPDRERSCACPGPRVLARHLRDQVRSGGSKGCENPPGLRPTADGAACNAARHPRRDYGLRNSLITTTAEDFYGKLVIRKAFLLYECNYSPLSSWSGCGSGGHGSRESVADGCECGAAGEAAGCDNGA